MRNKHLTWVLFIWLAFASQSVLIIPLQAAQSQKKYLIVSPGYDAGMFSHFLSVLGFLEHYEQGHYAGIKIDFNNRGLYYDEKYGLNWWEYYFAPLAIGSTEQAVVKKCIPRDCMTTAYFAIDHLSRQRAFELIQKYIEMKPDIKETLEDFIKTQFNSNFIIGVHYRGTDKITSGEARLVAYEEVLQVITNHINEEQLTDYKIFVATDECQFLNYLQNYFPNRIIYQEAQRSSNGQAVHIGTSNPYQTGREALLDALLLSRCHILIRTSSNLSLCSSYFNPSIPVTIIQGK